MYEDVYLIAQADQLAAEARDARCCNALDPCRHCQLLRQQVVARRYVVRFPTQRTSSEDDA